MTCPHCTIKIEATTGFQEAEKFIQHLKICPENPANRLVVNRDGQMVAKKDNPTIKLLR